jgi:hypothetical protein
MDAPALRGLFPQEVSIATAPLKRFSETMARIQDEQIEAARNVSITDVWLRLALPPVRAGTAFHSPLFREVFSSATHSLPIANT